MGFLTSHPRLTRAIAISLVALPACVVKFSERYAPIPNGGVTGPAADCAVVKPLPTTGVPEATPRVRLIGRFDREKPLQVPRGKDPGSDPVCDKEFRAQAGTESDGRLAQAFEWSGTGIQLRFDGTNAKIGIFMPPRAPVDARVAGQKADDPVQLLRFALVVDDSEPVFFNVQPCTHAYDLGGLYAKAGKTLSPGIHTFTVYRESEALFGQAFFLTDATEIAGTLLPPVVKPRKIELIGDSITCGYGALGPSATCPFAPVSQSNFVAYGSLAARMLGAEVQTECWSGKGLYQNYSDPAFPDDPDANAAAPRELLPLLWTRTLPSVGPLTKQEEVKWDFTKQEQPQVVVINLGTNDFTRDNNFDNVPDGFEEAKYTDAYYRFIKEVRGKHPAAEMFIAMSPMLSDQFPFVGARDQMRRTTRSVVERINAEGDPKVYFMELVEQGFRYGLGCDYHPNVEVHRIMAEQLAGAIRTKLCW